MLFLLSLLFQKLLLHILLWEEDSPGVWLTMLTASTTRRLMTLVPTAGVLTIDPRIANHFQKTRRCGVSAANLAHIGAQSVDLL